MSQQVNIEVIEEAIRSLAMDDLTFNSFKVKSGNSNSVKITYSLTVSSYGFFTSFYSSMVSSGEFTTELQMTARTKGANALMSASSYHVDVVCSRNCTGTWFLTVIILILILVAGVVSIILFGNCFVAMGYFVKKQCQRLLPSSGPAYTRVQTTEDAEREADSEGVELVRPSAPPLVYSFPPPGADSNQKTTTTDNKHSNNSNNSNSDSGENRERDSETVYPTVSESNNTFYLTVVATGGNSGLPEQHQEPYGRSSSVSIPATVVHPNDFSV
jgi:hypothetical protein